MEERAGSSSIHLHEYLSKRQVKPESDNKRIRLAAKFNFKPWISRFSCFPSVPSLYNLLHLKRNSMVCEIIALTDGLVLTLQKSGVCTIFRRERGGAGGSGLKLFGFVNNHPDEVVRSIFHNHASASLIVVSVFPSIRKSILRCRTIKVSDLEAGRFLDSKQILSEEALCFPGWVEICEANSKIFTFASESQVYKVWDLATCGFEYAIPANCGDIDGEEETTGTTIEAEDRILDVKASPGLLLLLYEPRMREGYKTQKIRLLDVMHGGKELYCYIHRIPAPSTGIKLVEQFADSIILKEEGGNEDLLVINLRTQPLATPYRVDLSSAKLDIFIVLHRASMFLTFQMDGRVVSRDRFGREVCELYPKFSSHDGEDVEEERASGQHVLLEQLRQKNGKIVVAKDQETLISVRHDGQDDNGSIAGRIEFKSCYTGEVLGRVPLTIPTPDSTVCNEITCVCYDDEQMMLMVGFKDGSISIWN